MAKSSWIRWSASAAVGTIVAVASAANSLALAAEASEISIAKPPSIGLVAPASEVAFDHAALASQSCAQLTAQGKHAEAIAACRRALVSDGSPANLRATVAALLHGGERPTTQQLLEAIMIIRGMHRNAPQGLFSLAAECDLFEGLGDWPAFAKCSAKLNELDPRHALSKRASAVMDSRRAKWYVGVGWWLFVSSFLVAMAHAATRKLGRVRRKSAISVAALSVGIGLAMIPRPAMAETPDQQPATAVEDPAAEPGQISHFKIDPNHPESSIPPDSEKNRDPLQFGYLLMDFSDRAELARKAGDHQSAIRYYQALAKAVPDRAVSYSKLCVEYQAINDLDMALVNCRNALGRGGVTTDDHLRYVDLALGVAGSPRAEAVADIDEIVAHLNKAAADATLGATVECKLGLRLKDPARMRHCTEQLGRVAPKSPQTVSYQWAYAVMRNDFRAAREYISDAKNLEMSADSIRNMEDATDRAVPIWQGLLRHGWLIGTASTVGLFCLALLFATRRRGRPLGSATAES